jgi:hypothetical protein|tara:strand:+ start:203 stop:391 length:189 start_codon:yes stop_codon:yes gene_type:complete
MIKEFEINDILNAVSSISRTDKKKNKITEIETKLTTKVSNLASDNQVKSNLDDILVLNEMID